MQDKRMTVLSWRWNDNRNNNKQERQKRRRAVDLGGPEVANSENTLENRGNGAVTASRQLYQSRERFLTP
jgi:hypothetical protein